MKKIEEVINDVLKGDAQKNALDFVAHLRANDVPLEEADNYWEVKYKGECLCYLFINGSDEEPGPWTIWSDQTPGSWASWDDYSGKSADETVDKHIKEIAWAHANVCGNCGGSCSPGKSKTILGKTFDNICNSTMAFTNPDAKALTCAKKMIDVRISDILGQRSVIL